VSASLLASPQAAIKKKRYIKLDLLTLVPSNSSGLFQAPQTVEVIGQGDQEFAQNNQMGLIGQAAAQTLPSHV
jgi:hypothetical protein